MKPVKVIAALLVGIAASFPSFAAKDSSEIATPKILTHIEKEGGKILNRFKISEHLNGFAVQVGMDRLIVYVTADGKHAFNGSLLDGDADDLTQKFAKKYLPEVDDSGVVEKLTQSSYLSTHEKASKRKLYVMHDPNCGFCKEAFKAIMALEPVAKVEVRWVPVAALGADSANKAAYILHDAKNGMKIQHDFNKGYQLSQAQMEASSGEFQKVLDNTKLMKFLNIQGTPAVIVVEDEKVVSIIQGFRRGDILSAMGV